MKISSFLGTILISCTALCLSTAASAAEKIESSPTGDRIVLDGDPSDWEGVPITYLEESLRVMAIAHDVDNLYLMYRFADEALARRLRMGGVTLWINGDGKSKKKKEEFAVRYPGSEQIAEQFEGQDPWEQRYQAETEGSEISGRSGPPPSLASMRQEPGQLTVIRMGIKETADENNPEGPSAASAFNEGLFCYELKIPFADIGGKIADADPTKGRKVAIGIQIGGMTEAEMEMVQAATKGEMGSMGGQGGRGGGMGGRPPSSMGDRGMGAMGGGMGGRGSVPQSRMIPEIGWLSITMPAGE
jgi:hypothetical protein